jgi:hypothetical protein
MQIEHRGAPTSVKVTREQKHKLVNGLREEKNISEVEVMQ